MEFRQFTSVPRLHATVVDSSANIGPSLDQIPKEHRTARVHSHLANHRLLGRADRSGQGKQFVERHGHNDDFRCGNSACPHRAPCCGLFRYELLV